MQKQITFISMQDQDGKVAIIKHKWIELYRETEELIMTVIDSCGECSKCGSHTGVFEEDENGNYICKVCYLEILDNYF